MHKGEGRNNGSYSWHDTYSRYSRVVTERETPSESMAQKETFVPPAKHLAADRAGKTLVNLAGAINRAVGADDEPIVVNRKGAHVSIKSLEELIDRALEG